MRLTYAYKQNSLAFLLLIGPENNASSKLETSLSSFYQKLERLEKPVHL